MVNFYTTNNTEQRKILRDQFLKQYKSSPIPDDEILKNLGLFININLMQRILWMHNLYQQIINVHGSVIEFGCRWGQNLALFELFRGIYEPYNFNRKVIGFDTFAGFPSVHEKDGNAKGVQPGMYNVSENYMEYLQDILNYQESEMPYPQFKKFSLVKGDASQTIDQYLKENPETIIALVYFDFDIYEPTYNCLKAIKPFVTKGSVIAFDELNLHDFPGETLALKEIFGLDQVRLQRSPLNPYSSYFVVE